MKKLFLATLVIGLLFGMVYSQSITVTSPHSGESWHKGSSYNITWAKSGSMNANVKIRLYNAGGTTKVLDIANSTSNDGSFSWNIPGTVANGNYILRIKTLDNAVFDDSDVFVITNASIPSANITVTNPHSGDNWAKGNPHVITWTKSGSMNANVKIKLYNTAGTTKILDITNSTPNDGIFSWNIPGTVADGNYIVRVKTLDNAVSDDSDVFRISNASTPASSITVTKPSSGEALRRGRAYTIRWTKHGTQNARVKISLHNSSGIRLSYLTNHTANNGNYSWHIPGNFTEGRYFVNVKTLDNLVFGNSGVFRVRAGVESGHGIPDWLKEKLRNMREIQWWKDPKGPIGPGPGPCLSCPARFDLEKYINILREGGMRGKFTVEVVRAGRVFGKAVFENNGVKQLRGGNKAKMLSGGTLRVMKLQKYSVVQGKALRAGRGFKVVIKNAQGRVVAEQPVNVRERR